MFCFKVRVIGALTVSLSYGKLLAGYAKALKDFPDLPLVLDDDTGEALRHSLLYR